MLPITVFWRNRRRLFASLSAVLIKEGRDAGRDQVRLEAEVRRAEEVIPSSTSRFIPFSPSSPFVFKETDLKGEEAPNKEQPARVDGNRERAARSELLNGAEAL